MIRKMGYRPLGPEAVLNPESDQENAPVQKTARSGDEKILDRILCFLVGACTLIFPCLVIGMGWYFAWMDSTYASQMVTQTSVRSRDWYQPNAVSMHYGFMDEHMRLYMCLKEQGLTAGAATLSDSFLDYRKHMMMYFTTINMNCDAQSDHGWPRDYGFFSCIRKVLNLNMTDGDTYLDCLDRAEGVMVASIQPPSGGHFLGSYNYAAFLLTGAAIISMFFAFEYGATFTTPDVQLSKDGYRIIRSVFYPMGQYATVLSAVLSVLYLIPALTYTFSTGEVYGNVEAQPGHRSFPNTPYTGLVALAGFLVCLFYFWGYLLTTYWYTGHKDPWRLDPVDYKPSEGRAEAGGRVFDASGGGHADILPGLNPVTAGQQSARPGVPAVPDATGHGASASEQPEALPERPVYGPALPPSMLRELPLGPNEYGPSRPPVYGPFLPEGTPVTVHKDLINHLRNVHDLPAPNGAPVNIHDLVQQNPGVPVKVPDFILRPKQTPNQYLMPRTMDGKQFYIDNDGTVKVMRKADELRPNPRIQDVSDRFRRLSHYPFNLLGIQLPDSVKYKHRTTDDKGGWFMVSISLRGMIFHVMVTMFLLADPYIWAGMITKQNSPLH